MSLRLERYRRFWAVYDGPQLLCVTVYKKGAVSVIDTVNALRRTLAKAASSTPTARHHRIKEPVA